MAASTRPLTLGEILDRTVQLYRRNFLLFAGMSVLPSAADVLISGSASIFFSARLPAIQNPANATGSDIAVFILVAAAFVLIGLPLLLGVAALAASALNYAAMVTSRGETTTIRASYAYGFRRFWHHVGVLSLQVLFAAVIPGAACFGVLMVGGMATALLGGSGAGPAFAVVFAIIMILIFIALFVACIWIWLRFCLAFPASAAEGIKAWPSLKRSNFLSKGTRGRMFVMYLLVAILTIVAYYLLTITADIVLKLTLYRTMAPMALLSKPPVLVQVVNLFISCLERSFVLPLYSIALLLFYTDQRTRLEGYDIEQLMAQAGWNELPQPLPSAAALESTSPAGALTPDSIAGEGMHLTAHALGNSASNPASNSAIAPEGSEA
jgi:hypothetical protein